ncbi:MAG: Nramp family divalent metal transporter, partial [Bacteroidota bacterium]
MTSKQSTKTNLLKTLGPGLLFASTAIGTSHLVLSTRAGAYHGMIIAVIILAALLLKYPFYEFGPRYACATGHSLLKGYRDQGKWAVWLFLIVVFVDMFTVTAAIGAVSAGLLSTLFGVTWVSIPILSGIIIAVTIAILLLGGYKGLDNFIKFISVVLLITVLIAFVAVLLKGPVEPVSEFTAPPLFEGAGLALIIGLIGWMPAGMEASTMNSIWNVEKMKATNYHPKLKESLFDFNLGYIFTIALAIMFLTIGAFTIYGTGQVLDGNATQFTNKLLAVFTSNLGDWSYYIIAIAAFGTIYGTLITVMDAFPRCFVHGIRVLKYEQIENDDIQNAFLTSSYKIVLIALGIGGFALFYFSAASMVKLLDVVTIISFMLAPFIGF